MRSGKARVWVNPVLGVVLLVLILAYLGKTGVIRPQWISANKNLLDAFTDIVNMLAVVFAAVFSYFRFFRGRVLTERVELALDITSITRPGGGAVQLVTLSIRNVGAVPLWQPIVIGTTTARYADGSTITRKVTDWDDGLIQHRSLGKHRQEVIDSGEAASYSAEVLLESSIWALTYVVSVATGHNEWSTMRIVAGPHIEPEGHARPSGKTVKLRVVGPGGRRRRA
jgi:hypothetical protein